MWFRGFSTSFACILQHEGHNGFSFFHRIRLYSLQCISSLTNEKKWDKLLDSTSQLYVCFLHYTNTSNCHLIVITWFQCVKKLLWVPMGSQIRHLWPRWPSPNILACLNLNLTQWHPLVAKFSNICHFRHFLRVPRKT